MQYTNPVLFADYSDPDVIRVGKDFFMVASSFHYAPCVPVLHSRNLVEWELINYVARELPFSRFSAVCAGDGAWAPSIRYKDGRYFCVIPFPDEGIYVSETEDPYGVWSPLRPLIRGKGIIDPCPVWTEEGCFLAVAFAKSRIGFNSRIGLYEVDDRLTRQISESYSIIYDGSDVNPTIEGPKFYRRDGYFYILAPAGGVKSGWQTALRSKNIYGPYESKVILMQNDSPVNGPHQGALIDLPDGNWAFMHFQDMRAYGRVVHLQPAVWRDGWILCGETGDGTLAGTPVRCGEYPVAVKTGYRLQESDFFVGDKLSMMWQTPATMRGEWYALDGGGLRLNCAEGAADIARLPQIFTAKITRLSFCAETRVRPAFREEGDEAGLAVTGESYAYVRVVRRGGENFIELCKNGEGGDETVFRKPCADGELTLRIRATNQNIYSLRIIFYVNGEKLPYAFYATAGRWTGAKIGLFARNANGRSEGSAVFRYYKTE